MNTLKDKFDSPAYWTQMVQLEIYDIIKTYIEVHGLTRQEFAERLGVSKGYVSQILNGDFDHRLSKLVQLALACDMVPSFSFIPRKYACEALDKYLHASAWNSELKFSILNELRTAHHNEKFGKTNRIGKSIVYDFELNKTNSWSTISKNNIA